MKAQRFTSSKVAEWRKTSFEVLTSEAVASRTLGPKAPPRWAPALEQLSKQSRKPVTAPPWWSPETAYFGSVETQTDPATYVWDGMKRIGHRDPPLFAFQLTLAGWGHFETYGRPPLRVSPGTAFIALMPSRHRYYLPTDSPGWTFAWISIYHPYLLSRMTKLVATMGPLIEAPPDGPLAAIVLRLVRGAIKKDFGDRFEVELALFEFLLACEQGAQKARDSSQEDRRLEEAVRARVLESLPKANDVESLASEYGMSRTHFSHFFRARTGLTPARFATEVRVQEAARMIAETVAPLKQIADACGFTDANYFGKVFRRFRQMSPGAYRRALRRTFSTRRPPTRSNGLDSRASPIS